MSNQVPLNWEYEDVWVSLESPKPINSFSCFKHFHRNILHKRPLITSQLLSMLSVVELCVRNLANVLIYKILHLPLSPTGIYKWSYRWLFNNENINYLINLNYFCLLFFVFYLVTPSCRNDTTLWKGQTINENFVSATHPVKQPNSSLTQCFTWNYQFIWSIIDVFCLLHLQTLMRACTKSVLDMVLTLSYNVDAPKK